MAVPLHNTTAIVLPLYPRPTGPRRFNRRAILGADRRLDGPYAKSSQIRHVVLERPTEPPKGPLGSDHHHQHSTPRLHRHCTNGIYHYCEMWGR